MSMLKADAKMRTYQNSHNEPRARDAKKVIRFSEREDSSVLSFCGMALPNSATYFIFP
jgi:hypothetical protein